MNKPRLGGYRQVRHLHATRLFSPCSSELTILTTNFSEQLPDALIDRPGRFHDVPNFDLPPKRPKSHADEMAANGGGEHH
jgi:hypothetical protein